jgi:hypothetical protein
VATPIARLRWYGSRSTDYSVDVGAALPAERRGRKTWEDLDEVAEWVARYLAERASSTRPGQRNYDVWARQTGGAPWSLAFRQHGGWAAALRRARELAAHAR